MREHQSEHAAQAPTVILVLVCLVSTMGTWFPMGYNLVAMNSQETVILNWIRSVRCERLGGNISVGIYDPSPSNTTSESIDQSTDGELQIPNHQFNFQQLNKSKNAISGLGINVEDSTNELFVQTINAATTESGWFMGNLSCGWTNSLITDEKDAVLELWCKKVEEKDEREMLANNPELNRIWAAAASLLNCGALISTFTCSFCVKKLGLRGALAVCAGCFICGTIVFCLAKIAKAYELLILGRIILGFALGYVAVVPHMYTSELTPAIHRGLTGTFSVILLVLGMITATTMGLPMVLGNAAGWLVLVALQLGPIVIMCVALPFCPESPRHLYITKSDKEGARKVLVWLRGTLDVSEELAEMQREVDTKIGGVYHAMTVLDIARDPVLRFAMLLCAVPMLSAQLCGYETISYYSTSIFNGIGLTMVDAIYVTIGVWVAQLLFSVISMLLVDRIGRRALMMVSNGVMMSALLREQFTKEKLQFRSILSFSFLNCLSLLGSLGLLVMCMSLTKLGYVWTKYASVACVVLHIAAFAMGAAAVPWILMTEMFAQEARTSAAAINSVVCWSGALLTTLAFPLVVTVLKEYTFLIFVGCIFVATVFIFWKQPETKGRTIDEIQQMLRRRR